MSEQTEKWLEKSLEDDRIAVQALETIIPEILEHESKTGTSEDGPISFYHSITPIMGGHVVRGDDEFFFKIEHNGQWENPVMNISALLVDGFKPDGALDEAQLSIVYDHGRISNVVARGGLSPRDFAEILGDYVESYEQK